LIDRIKSLLRRYRNQDAIAHSSVNLLIAQVISVTVLFIVDVLFARHFSLGDFGNWKQILLIINFIIPLFSFGLPEGFKYYAAYDGEHWRKHFQNIMMLILAATAIITVLVLSGVFSWITQLLSNPKLSSILIFFPFLFLLIAVGNVLRYTLINNQATHHYLRAMLLSSSLSFLFYLGLVYVYPDLANTSLFLTVLASGILGGHLVRILYMMAAARALSIKFLHISKQDFIGYFQYGFPLYITSFITLIVLNIDKTIVSYFEGTEQFAIYSIGAKEIPFLSLVASVVAQAQFPMLVRLLKSNKKRFSHKLWLATTVRISYLVYPLIAILMLFAEPLILLFFGENYHDAVPIFRGYLLILLWRNNYYGALLAAAGKTKWITFYSFLTMVVNVIFSLLFYQLWGVIGVVYATVLAVTVANLLQLNHERLLLSFFKKMLTNPKLLLMIIGILVIYFLF